MNDDLLVTAKHADMPDAAPSLGGGFYPDDQDTPLPRWDGEQLSVILHDGWAQRWRLANRDGEPVLTLEQTLGELGLDTDMSDRLCALAALEAALARAGNPADLAVVIEDGLRHRLWQDGVIAAEEGAGWRVFASALFQLPDLWLRPLGQPASVYPARYTVTDGRYHPRRSSTLQGKVYARHIPWLDKTFSLRLVDLDRDLLLFHRWQNDPRIAPFWLEEGDLDYHRRYLQALLDDPHVIPLIGSLDDRPFGYFEVYWAKENRLGLHYDADDYDRGWHVLIGEDDVRGREYITAWMPSIVHYMLLSDPRTRQIVGEPAADHHQQIRNLDLGGFAKIKEFDFPHKRALLVSLSRARYFAERLWVPRT